LKKGKRECRKEREEGGERGGRGQGEGERERERVVVE